MARPRSGSKVLAALFDPETVQALERLKQTNTTPSNRPTMSDVLRSVVEEGLKKMGSPSGLSGVELARRDAIRQVQHETRTAVAGALQGVWNQKGKR